MDRREFLSAGAATVAALSVSEKGLAQTSVAPVPMPELTLSAYSRNLQWLRTPQELAKGVIDIGLSRVDLTVSRGGHVEPARAASDLPAFIDGLKRAGVSTTCITTEITDAVGAEAIIKAAAASGVTHYVWGGLRYDETKPYQPQLDALKGGVEALASLNKKYRIKGLYQPARGAGSVGSTFLDILSVMRGLDPRYIGVHYNTANLLQATPETTTAQLRLGQDYIGGVAITDAQIKLVLPVWEEGPYKGDAMLLADAYSGGDFTGGPGTPEALGGGGRALPYRFMPVRAGTGMLDLTTLGKTLRQIGFNGPIETQVDYALAGVESGAAAIDAERLYVLGTIKRDRLTVEHAFRGSWKVDVALPAFMSRG